MDNSLLVACQRGKSEEAILLIEQGKDVNFQDSAGNTVLIYAVLSQMVEVIEKLIEYGADINIKNHNGFCAFSIAVRAEYESVISKLLELNDKVFPIDKKLNINAPTSERMTLLTTSILKGNSEELCLKLIELGANVDVDTSYKYKFMQIPLLIACHCKMPKIVQALLDEGANINRKTKEGLSIMKFVYTKEVYDVLGDYVEKMDKDIYKEYVSQRFKFLF